MVNLIFLVLILVSVIIVPLALFLWEPFKIFGGIHIFSVIVSVFAIWVVLKNPAIKKYFSESYDYLFIGIILLSGTHISEIIFEYIFNLEDMLDGKFISFLEHTFFFLGVLSIAYAFYKMKEPTIDEKLLEE